MSDSKAQAERLLQAIRDKEAQVGIIGLGYVGLPLAAAFHDGGYRVIGFDIDPEKVDALQAGRSFIRHIDSDVVGAMVTSGRFRATTDFSDLSAVDAILICVPTPLTRYREPDMTYVVGTTESIARHLRSGQLVVLESTTYPGTTVELLRPVLEKSGLTSGTDFFLAYSPEREDPGNPKFSTTAIPKVVGGDGETACELACALYEQVVTGVVPVSSAQTAEAIKLTENIFRAVNIALVNELKVIYEAMGIDVWEVIEAAKTKPFGFMPFYPGPGLGGHCIPIDPFYLTWKAREFGINTRFIELAGEINTAMPRHVIDRLAEALNNHAGKALRGAKVLLMGLAYKKNVDDIRESPAFKLMELLEARGADVDYYDPYVPEIQLTREHPTLAGRKAIAYSAENLQRFDAALVCTDHDSVDYQFLADNCSLVIDTRNAMARTRPNSGTVFVKA